jgi:dTDP-4-amino-4,6-dideoxygalactose transaminase
VIPRHQLPVLSPIEVSAIVGAVGPALAGTAAPLLAVSSAVRERYGASAVALTDSGTSALVIALRLAAGRGGTVAYPAYGCVDLAAAAERAGVKVRLYDVDPRTLGADLDSLRSTLRRGVDAVVAVHLFGYPADVPAIIALAGEHGVNVIEDAAQGASGTLRNVPLGGLGPLSVLSFGRGKGTSGGNGGALLAVNPRWNRAVTDAAAGLGRPRAGWGDLTVATAQWMLGRPSIYGIPAGIPSLHLGEMVYHPAGEPKSLSTAAAALVRRALRAAAEEVKARRRNAERLLGVARAAERLSVVGAEAGAEPGYLRFPVLDAAGRAAAVRLGVLRPYPGTLCDQGVLVPLLHPGETAGPGAEELGRRLFTLPTHSRLMPSDFEKLARWLRN